MKTNSSETSYAGAGITAKVNGSYAFDDNEYRIVSLIVNELEKRKEKEVCEKIVLSGSAFYICPSCRISMSKEYQAYCDRCGQKLKWGKLDLE